MKKAIVLCSGGIDSVTTAYIIKKKFKYKDILILFFNYGQRNLISERHASKFCAKEIKARFLEVNISNLKDIIKSILISQSSIKKISKKSLIDTKKESLAFYVPCRNILFLTYAIAIAESIAKNKDRFFIFTGFKHEGEEFFPDTSPQFVKSFNKMSQISTINKIKVNAPLISKDKEDIIKLSFNMGVKLNKTFSCYDSYKVHCGICLACRLRKEGFYWANIADPTFYKY